MRKSIVALIAALCLHAYGANASSYRTVSAREFAQELRKGKRIVLDVRPSHLYEKWGLRCPACVHVNIPIEVGAGDFFLEDVLKSTVLRRARATEILVVCWIGVLSSEAARILVQHGFKPVMLEGGLHALPDSMLVGERPPPPPGG